MKKLFIEPGIFAIQTQVLDTQMHQHTLIQLTIPVERATLTLENQQTTHNLISLLKASAPHQLSMQQGWVILIEPSSQLGLQANAILNNNNYKTWPPADISNIANLSELLKTVGLHYQPLTSEENHHLDPRIAALLAKLNQCFNQACIKPEHWLAKDIAHSLNVSESRFLHLFKENMQLPWRPYLLWRRLICAIQAINKGHNATQAAYIAGFSDSAHLSRTFKKQFGITLRDALVAVPKNNI
ncbi:hypothetical protein PSECIP111854_01394 [Pseudoalteromonas sp. CIP111854]|uniref:HTH araC/xylS-type domain-containing protein n=1 Tax=Pseudoalteromonas holothuriae TaxID=2963714 RepID=A0A9W4VP03_9GAMM|nr:helix-turn-helix domain-containing protein [Pseudoalteromonas sp. CIP111854]CAH9054536.1 hypothetical protein PSECIP111854_01394 [Pseudoalteromonas sp. CIP111854]